MRRRVCSSVPPAAGPESAAKPDTTTRLNAMQVRRRMAKVLTALRTTQAVNPGKSLEMEPAQRRVPVWLGFVARGWTTAIILPKFAGHEANDPVLRHAECRFPG